MHLVLLLPPVSAFGNDAAGCGDDAWVTFAAVIGHDLHAAGIRSINEASDNLWVQLS